MDRYRISITTTDLGTSRYEFNAFDDAVRCWRLIYDFRLAHTQLVLEGYSDGRWWQLQGDPRKRPL